MKRVIAVMALLIVSLLQPSVVGNAQGPVEGLGVQDFAPAMSVADSDEPEATNAPSHEDVRLVSMSSPVGTYSHRCTIKLVCGHIYNDDDRYSLLITDNWAAFWDAGTWRILYPGQNSGQIGVQDADGLYVPLGCVATIAFVQQVGPGWYKVADPQHIHVTNMVC